MKITRRQLRRLIRETLLLKEVITMNDFEATNDRWTFRAGVRGGWTLSNDDGLEIEGSEMSRSNWPILGNSPLDDALEKFDNENEDHFKFGNGKAGVAFEKVAPAWAQIEFDSPEKEDAEELWDVISDVRNQIATSGG